MEFEMHVKEKVILEGSQHSLCTEPASSPCIQCVGEVKTTA